MPKLNQNEQNIWNKLREPHEKTCYNCIHLTKKEQAPYGMCCEIKSSINCKEFWEGTMKEPFNGSDWPISYWEWNME